MPHYEAVINQTTHSHKTTIAIIQTHATVAANNYYSNPLDTAILPLITILINDTAVRHQIKLS